ncbi:MAG: cytochrome P450 [Chloroflexota bacterium]|nr:cytochrome P450 [Chloroflexota bacterium]
MSLSMGVKPFERIPVVDLPDDYQFRVGPFLAEMYRQHGPIFRARNFGVEVVYLVGPEANRFVLQSERQRFSHHMGWGEFFGVDQVFGDGLLSMDGAEHDAHRRLMNPAFTIAYMDRYVPLMSRIIRERIADWGARGEVDVYDEARKITFDVAAEALVGLRTGPEVDHFRTIFQQMLMLGMMVNSQAEWETRMAALHAELDGLIRPKIAERRAHPTDDILGLLASATDADGQPLSDERIIAHANILLVAGHETSTSLAAWLLYQLTQEPAVTQRVVEEQLALVGPTAEPTLDDIKRMKYLDLVLLEAERFYPPVSNGPRGAVEDFEFAGYHVPAGTYVFYSIAASHLLPASFAEPERFDPERFAAPREEHKHTSYALVGFGGGPRVCIGINFAKVEIKALVSQALRRYEFEAVPDQQLVQFYRVTAVPLYGIRLHVRKRGAIAE